MANRFFSKAVFPTASLLIVAAMAASLSTSVFAAGPVVTPGENGWSDEVGAEDYTYKCPTNMAMTGRAHYGSEDEGINMRCMPFISYGEVGTLSARIANTPDHDGVWSPEQYEGKDEDGNHVGHDYTCPNGEVLTGIGHTGDENGRTTYRCSVLKINGEAKKLTPGTQHKVKESDHAYVCTNGQAFIRRAHLCSGGAGSACDENRDTIYQCGYVRGTD